MFLSVHQGEGAQLLGDETSEAFVERHAQRADTFGFQAARCGKNEMGSIGLEQVNRADVGLESAGDQGYDVAERLRRLAAVFCEIPDFFESQNVLRIARMYRLAQARLTSFVTN
jgi:hypothetical protein